jgi:hypothetical protein
MRTGFYFTPIAIIILICSDSSRASRMNPTFSKVPSQKKSKSQSNNRKNSQSFPLPHPHTLNHPPTTRYIRARKFSKIFSRAQNFHPEKTISRADFSLK